MNLFLRWITISKRPERPHDVKVKNIMNSVGLPNSTTLYVKLFQLINEIEFETTQRLKDRVIKELSWTL